MDTWEELLKDAFEETGDDFNSLITTLSKEELKVEFNGGYGTSQGKPFTAWGNEYVYFPIVYDGSEWVGYAPRNVCDKKTDHWGGQ